MERELRQRARCYNLGCDRSGPSFLVCEMISTGLPGRQDGRRDGTVDCQLEVIFKCEALTALMVYDQPTPQAHRPACCPGALSSTKQCPDLLPALPCMPASWECGLGRRKRKFISLPLSAHIFFDPQFYFVLKGTAPAQEGFSLKSSRQRG